MREVISSELTNSFLEVLQNHVKILGISFVTSLTQVILCSDNNASRVESKALKKWSMKYVCMVRSGFLPDESNINAKRVGFNPHFFQQQG